MLILRHAWLNLWDKHMTTGRINQVSRAKSIPWRASICSTLQICLLRFAFSATFRKKNAEFRSYTTDAIFGPHSWKLPEPDNLTVTDPKLEIAPRLTPRHSPCCDTAEFVKRKNTNSLNKFDNFAAIDCQNFAFLAPWHLPIVSREPKEEPAAKRLTKARFQYFAWRLT